MASAFQNIKWGNDTFKYRPDTLIVYNKDDKKVGTFNPDTKEIMSLTKPDKLMPKPRAKSVFDLYKTHFRPILKLKLPDLTPQQLARELTKQYNESGIKDKPKKKGLLTNEEIFNAFFIYPEGEDEEEPEKISPPVSTPSAPSPQKEDQYIKSGLTSEEEEEEEEEVAVITKITDTTLQHQTPPPPEEIKPMNPLSTKLFELVYEIKDLYINSPSKDIDKDYPEYAQLYNLLGKVGREGYVPNEEKMKFIEDAWKKYQLIEGFNIDTTSEEDEGDISSDLSSLVSDQEEEEEEKEDSGSEYEEGDFDEVLEHLGEMIEYEKKVKHKDYIPQTEEEYLLHTYGDPEEGKGYGMWAISAAKDYMKHFVPRVEESLGLTDEELYDELTRRLARMKELGGFGRGERAQLPGGEDKEFDRMWKIVERMSDREVKPFGWVAGSWKGVEHIIKKKEEPLIKPTDEEWVFITQMEDKYPDEDLITEAQEWEFGFLYSQGYGGAGDRDDHIKRSGPKPGTTLEEHLKFFDRKYRYSAKARAKAMTPWSERGGGFDHGKWLLEQGYTEFRDEVQDPNESAEEETSSSEEDEGFIGFNLGDSDDTTTDDE